MVTEEQLEQLDALNGRGSRVLSIDLDLDPASQVRGAHRIAFEDLVEQARELKARLFSVPAATVSELRT